MPDFDYDLVVIGGGSGGISCARESVKLGAKVALFDYVKPTPIGTKWGLGGTCVNVGCIPKKLMHYTALLGASFHDAKKLGWNIIEPNHNWLNMIQTIQSHVKSLNFGYRADMIKNKVIYKNELVRFIDPYTISYMDKRTKNIVNVKAKQFVIAVGGRPNYPNIPGAKQFGITSDDIFSLRKFPGKVLLVGASYISLETAGFLNELGCDVSVAVRSILLRGFDRECAERIGDYMQNTGTRFMLGFVPTKLEKNQNKIMVSLKNLKTGDTFNEEFDTVLFATGRHPDTAELNLESAGVQVSSNGKIDAVDERTNVDHIYAIGDVLNNRQELTPVAIQAGLLLARRLFGSSEEKMDYDLVPTTVFTPIEYGAIGFSEENAKEKFGKENIEVFLSAFTPLEFASVHRLNISGSEISNPAFVKLICLKTEKNRVVGFHYIGPNAGEVTQGFAVSMRLGATKKHFDSTVGIHPTTAETLTTLRITKSSGLNYEASGC